MLVFLGLAFYRLFKGVDQNLAILVVIFGGVMPALINFVGVVNDAAALSLAHGGDFLPAFDKPQRGALAMLFVKGAKPPADATSASSAADASSLGLAPH